MKQMSCLDVSNLIKQQFPKEDYDKKFRENDVSGKDLAFMNREDLRSLGIKNFGHLRRLESILFTRDEDIGSITNSRGELDLGIRVQCWRIEYNNADSNFYLHWDPVNTNESKLPDDIRKILEGGKSRPIKEYDNFRDTLSDGTHHYFVEDADRDPKVRCKEFESILKGMKKAGIKVTQRANAYLTFEVETSIFWHEPNLIREKKVKLKSKNDNVLGDFPIVFPEDSSLPVDPEKLFGNALEGSVTFVEREEFFNPVTGIVHVHYKHHGTLEEQMELHRFPFDRQLLHIFILVNSGDYQFIPAPPRRWKLSKHVSRRCIDIKLRPRVSSEFQMLHSLMDISGDNGKLVFKARVQRLTFYYFLNVILPLFVITTLASTAFLIDPENIADRINLVVALLLTSVAFKFAVSDHIPLISYLTFVDVYILNTNLVLAFVAVESVVVRDATSEELSQRVDRGCFSAFLTIWFSFHVVFLLLVLFGCVRKSWDKVEADNKIEKEEQNDGGDLRLGKIERGTYRDLYESTHEDEEVTI
eukprot:jgi/Bigna1/88735/estExt_fgenesh1_pg.C_370077